MRAFLIFILLAAGTLCAPCQTRKVQNRPYIDLRPMHFGISIGMNIQDIELQNIGTQVTEDGSERTVVCDADMWNPGFSVGVLTDLRLNNHFNVRITPMLHFGSKRLVFRDIDELNESGRPMESTQDLKNTYISMPVDLKFSAERFNNYRPYLLAGVSPMINLSGKDQDYLQLKRFDTMIEVGMGCDFYLPFFKFIPELKFCYGLTNALSKSHVNELTDMTKRLYSQSVVKAGPTKMVIFSLHFE